MSRERRLHLRSDQRRDRIAERLGALYGAHEPLKFDDFARGIEAYEIDGLEL